VVRVRRTTHVTEQTNEVDADGWECSGGDGKGKEVREEKERVIPALLFPHFKP